MAVSLRKDQQSQDQQTASATKTHVIDSEGLYLVQESHQAGVFSTGTIYGCDVIMTVTLVGPGAACDANSRVTNAILITAALQQKDPPSASAPNIPLQCDPATAVTPAAPSAMRDGQLPVTIMAATHSITIPRNAMELLPRIEEEVVIC